MALDHIPATVSAVDPATLTLAQAVFLAEHPQAIERDFSPADRPRVTARMDELFATARTEQPLLWQAYQARCRRRGITGTLTAARCIAALRRAGGTPPETPALR